ncbi:Reverse transcriptase zinc-binding domain [Quillaja saponaria]|uniref:Reverse transcriptase zinc-binding domain n=1 Tax=Quillaja saponaria TaxID=32244 RepID=A0AAD7LUA6_QUISA|nr:Reverse transcriptase zinc-binding domain [Quillaja saponaria]
MVNQFIDTNSMWRKTSLLSEVFDELTAASISNIPLSVTGRDDKLIWHFTPRCIYTVSSGFQVLTSHTSNYRLPTLDWKTIWNRKILHKLKVFMWWLVHDSVAVRNNLRSIIGGVEDSCCLCRLKSETKVHEMQVRLTSVEPSVS